ncbi:MAG: cytochrome c [Terriglobales bacterium]|jgi:mono/diheme cytochrome c family protein
MRNFILGIVFAIVVLLLAGIGLALLGFLPTRANTPPSQTESHFAMSALDSSVDRHAPHMNNPQPPTDENLISGMKIFVMNCAGCHGGLDRKPVEFGRAFYPPAPNLIMEPDDDPEWHIFYVIHNGVRYAGMPAWDKTLSDADTWKVTAFLSHIEKLPPAVQDYWKKSTGTEAPPASEEPEHHDHH